VGLHALVRYDDYRLSECDNVVIEPLSAIPVDLHRDNKLYIVPVEDIVAVIRKGGEGRGGVGAVAAGTAPKKGQLASREDAIQAPPCTLNTLPSSDTYTMQ